MNLYAYEDILHACPIFTDITSEELFPLLGCLAAKKISYPKDSLIHDCGDHTDCLGVVLSGSVHILKEDFWGNTNLIARCLPGDVFGESYATRPLEPLEISVRTETFSEILFLNVPKMMTLCANACALHNQLTRNLLTVLAERNFQLSRKLEHLTKRSTREKLLSYLGGEARHRGNASFDIPFNRQQLADYLSVDRSAMSSELGRLRDEGLIHFHKNHFTVRFPSS